MDARRIVQVCEPELHCQLVLAANNVVAISNKSITAYSPDADSVVWQKELEQPCKYIGQVQTGVLLQFAPAKLTLIDSRTGAVVWQRHSLVSGQGYLDVKTNSYWVPTNAAVSQISLGTGELDSSFSLTAHHVPNEVRLDFLPTGMIIRGGTDSSGQEVVAMYGPLSSSLQWINRTSRIGGTGTHLLGSALNGDPILYHEVKAEVIRLDAETGKEVSRMEVSRLLKPFLIDGRRLLYVDRQSQLCLSDLEGQKLAWSQKISATILSSPVVFNRRIWLVKDEETVITCDFATGSDWDEMSIGMHIYSNIAAVSNRLFVVNAEGYLYSVDLN